MQDFYLVQSGDNGSTYDILYVLSATSNTAGTIAKYSLVGGSWTANGSYTTTFGGFGLAAADAGSGEVLYVSTGQGALAANSVVKVADAAGYNATINVTTGNNVTLYTTASRDDHQGPRLRAGWRCGLDADGQPLGQHQQRQRDGADRGHGDRDGVGAVSGDQTVSLGVSGTGITSGDYTLSNTTITIPERHRRPARSRSRWSTTHWSRGPRRPS